MVNSRVPPATISLCFITGLASGWPFRMADCIYVLKDGLIAEEGTHEELVQLGGTYAHLFEIQAKSYR